jgi:hypothetical protein
MKATLCKICNNFRSSEWLYPLKVTLRELTDSVELGCGDCELLANAVVHCISDPEDRDGGTLCLGGPVEKHFCPDWVHKTGIMGQEKNQCGEVTALQFFTMPG